MRTYKAICDSIYYSPDAVFKPKIVYYGYKKGVVVGEFLTNYLAINAGASVVEKVMMNEEDKAAFKVKQLELSKAAYTIWKGELYNQYNLSTAMLDIAFKAVYDIEPDIQYDGVDEVMDVIVNAIQDSIDSLD